MYYTICLNNIILPGREFAALAAHVLLYLDCLHLQMLTFHQNIKSVWETHKTCNPYLFVNKTFCQILFAPPPCCPKVTLSLKPQCDTQIQVTVLFFFFKSQNEFLLLIRNQNHTPKFGLVSNSLHISKAVPLPNTHLSKFINESLWKFKHFLLIFADP